MLQGSIWGLVRGDDSTGVFQVNKGWNIRHHKLDVDGYHFARNKRAQDFFKDADTSLATIMHHRAATHGTVSQENAHPFEHYTDDGMIIGVHNGTLNTWMRKEDNVSFEVDSDWLYYKIAKHGALDAMANHLHGAYALVWASTPDNRIHIAANGGRPIHWAYVDGKNQMLIASEAQMLYALASRNGLAIERPVYPEKGQIYTFDPRGDLRQYAVEAVPEPKRAVATAHAPREHLRPSGSSRLVTDNANLLVEDLYTPTALNKSGFKHMEKVEFFFSRAEIARESVGTTNQQRWDLRGELITEVDDEAAIIKDAVIRSMSQTVMENVRDADRVLCNVIGMRNIIDKKTGICQSVIILSPPDVSFFTNEERERKESKTEEPPTLADLDDLDDIPWAAGVKGPRGKLVTVGEFLSLVKDGCSNCTCNISLADAPHLGWHTSGAGAYPICATCCRDPALMGNV